MKATSRVELHGGLANGHVAEHDGSGVVHIELYRGNRLGEVHVGIGVYEVNDDNTAAFWLHNTWEPTKHHE